MTKDEALKLALEVLEDLGMKHFESTGEVLYKETFTTIKEALAQPEQDGKCKYCTDGCHACDARKLPEQEPVAWVGLDLDNMAEAFHRVIEEHHSRKNPFHDPVNGDAMLALRELRGLVAYMKRNTTPPQRTWVGLTDEEITQLIFWSGGRKTTQNLMSNPMQVREHFELWNQHIYKFARAIEVAHGIAGEKSNAA